MLSLSIDFYIRVFVRVYTSPSEVKRSASKRSYIFQCTGCPSFVWQPVGKRLEEGTRRRYTPGLGPTAERFCPHCGRGYQLGGPFWTDPIHSPDYIDRMLAIIKEKTHFATHERMLGTISMVKEVRAGFDLFRRSPHWLFFDFFCIVFVSYGPFSVLFWSFLALFPLFSRLFPLLSAPFPPQELHDVPLYYLIPALSGAIHATSAPHAMIRSALLHLGYRVSSSHAHSDALKTDAPTSVLWDIVRCFEKLNPVVRANIKPNSPAAAILAKPTATEANFEMHPDAVPPSRKLVRFPDKPANWGPMARARIGAGNKDDEEADQTPQDAKEQMVKRRLEKQGKKGAKKVRREVRTVFVR